MKKLKKRYVAATMALALVLAAGIASVSQAAAVPNNGTTQKNPMSTLVNAIATKFNLNTTDVQKVFDEQRTQMEAERQVKEAERLAQAVTDGKLTQSQADRITTKMKELQATRESLKDASETERQTAMKTQMDSLKQWMTDNNIPAGYLPMGGPGHHGPGMGRQGGQGFKGQSGKTSDGQGIQQPGAPIVGN